MIQRRLAIPAAVFAVCVLAIVLFWPFRQMLQVASLESNVSLTEPLTLITHPNELRDLGPYEGLGSWVDGFDYSPAYLGTSAPGFSYQMIPEMASYGVKTLYLQAGRLDDRSPDVLEDRWVLAEILMTAHEYDIEVVAWYLPKWTADATDFAHIVAASDFNVLGHRFDGVAIDIEWTEDGLSHQERNSRLIALSKSVDNALGEDPIGAIVLPPVQLEVINESLWPGFPYQEIAPFYDVWLPMSYWSFRTDPYGNGYSYNYESIERLRTNLGDPTAPVHAIGGVGASQDAAPAGQQPYIAQNSELAGFVRSITDSNSIGGSIYDWATMDSQAKALMKQLFEQAGLATTGN